MVRRFIDAQPFFFFATHDFVSFFSFPFDLFRTPLTIIIAFPTFATTICTDLSFLSLSGVGIVQSSTDKRGNNNTVSKTITFFYSTLGRTYCLSWRHEISYLFFTVFFLDRTGLTPPKIMVHPPCKYLCRLIRGWGTQRCTQNLLEGGRWRGLLIFVKCWT
jgi:hypothetical protein